MLKCLLNLPAGLTKKIQFCLDIYTRFSAPSTMERNSTRLKECWLSQVAGVVIIDRVPAVPKPEKLQDKMTLRMFQFLSSLDFGRILISFYND